MKDTLLKYNSTPPLLPKSKLGIQKKKMAAKKGKEHKTPIMKVGKSKKLSNTKKKAKTNKDVSEPTVKRKRGRPRNEDRLHIKKPVKEQKCVKKTEGKAAGRKRKLNLNAVIKNEILPPSKKSKISDNCNSVNGDIKLPIHKPLTERDSFSVEPHSLSSNGSLPSKKTVVSGQKKLPFTLKSATFLPPPKKELLNGNSCPAPFKFQTVKSKSSSKKDAEPNYFLKDFETNSRVDKASALSKEPLTNELAKFHSKDLLKFNSKEPFKSMFKEPVKCLLKDSTKISSKDQSKIQSMKPAVKEPTKSMAKDSLKSLSKEQLKSQTKEPVKSLVSTKVQIKEPVKSSKPVVKPIRKEPIKSHPQRMASLDALAKMHVICVTDRKPPEPKRSSETVAISQPFSHQKSITQCHERIQFDVKKETNDFKGNIVHKQEINYVKEKQQVFVSHSVEQSSIVEHEQSKTISTKVQHEPEKRKLKLSDKTVNNKQLKSKLKQSPSNYTKSLENLPKPDKGKSKISKIKDGEKKSAKVLCKGNSKTTKAVKEKPDSKSICKKTKKVEQTKSEVKVKETIRMQKTCTYQSVTTVNSHGSTNSNVVPVSHVGMTTNISKTKKTVVTDEECKNKVNYSTGSVINNSYCLTTKSPCAVGVHTDCCKFHSHPQIIPVAHVQPCSLGSSLNRTSDASTAQCDGSCTMRRFGHQQPVIFAPPSDCGCFCSSSLVQNVHDSCILRKSVVAYPPHHLPSCHAHLSAATNFAPEAVCSDCHTSSTARDSQKPHHPQHFTISSPSTHSRITCCACCELQRESNQHHHQSSLQYVSEPKTSSSLVPCEQTPLDLSLSSATSNMSIDSDISLPQGHCSNPLCCSRDLLLLRTSSRGFQHNFSSSKPCCRCSKQIVCETQAVDAVQSLSSCPNKSIIKIGQPQTVDHVSLLASSPSSQGSVHPVASNKNIPCVITDDSLVTAKREKSISPKQSSKLALIPKKRMFAHGWSWKGKPKEKLIALTNDSVPSLRVCYPSVEHKEGDTISERDCVLLRSGPKDTDLPYVAKVAAFWENPEDGEMMMSLLWYYRPEHTDQGRKPGQVEDEVFASRHKDINSVACIEDKCYVLTFNEYCRYRAILSMEDDIVTLSSATVPELSDGYPRRNRLPYELVAQDIVFFCRHVYDFRQKRILKNPT